MEEYRSLYRKYRPQAPSDVLGQEHVVRALAGAVNEGRLAHAFLFSGPRGTGKTSTARILAKMVNCERGPTPEPCGECEQCIRIRDGSHLDVVEIDAASHGGVDDARELRERAPTAPAQGREKVYIIDEAQRLSAPAFDALLKVFEEPPQGVRFVLATTEPHKMPATIAGRCQRFEFRRIPADTIVEQLQKVSSAEAIDLTATAAEVIARQSEGSVRDALSLLDQASVLGGGKVTEDIVAQLVGTPETDVQFSLADAVAVGDAREVFRIVHELVQEGHDLRHFAARVTAHFRDLLLVLASPDDPAILDVGPEEHQRLAAQAGKFSPGELDRVLSHLLQAQTDMRWSTAPRLTLELALVRAALPETDPAPAALLARVERLERLAGLPQAAQPPAMDQPASSQPADAAAGGGEMATVSEKPKDAASDAATGDAVETNAPTPVDSPAGAHAPTAGAVDAHMLRNSWSRVVEALKERRRMVLSANAEVATVAAFDGDTLEIVFPPGRESGARTFEQKQDQVREVLEELFGVAPKLKATVRQGIAQDVAPDDPPASPEDAEELLRKQFGAHVVEEE